MNCDSAQQEILLGHAGELAAGRADELQNHLAECPLCREYKARSAKLLYLASSALPTGTPSAKTTERIMAAGKLKVAGRRRLFLSHFSTPQLLAMAASFLILAAGSLLIIAHSRVDVNAHGQRVTQMSTIAAMVTEDDVAVAEAASRGNARSDLHALAQQILRVEGLMVEDSLEEEEAIPDEDAQSRDLRLRSTFDSQPEECA